MVNLKKKNSSGGQEKSIFSPLFWASPKIPPAKSDALSDLPRIWKDIKMRKLSGREQIASVLFEPFVTSPRAELSALHISIKIWIFPISGLFTD